VFPAGYNHPVALRVRVCRLDEIVPGGLRGFVVAGVTWPVMVATVDGELVAFPGVCPHDDVPLDDYGVMEGEYVRCRVHGYRFDVRDGHCEHQPQLHLRRYKITIAGDELYVDLL
jgi:nitrite reductase/ring-hydroxylating ferredoxin subunit